MVLQLAKKIKATSAALKLAALALAASLLFFARETNGSLALLGVNPDPFCIFDWAQYLLQTENRIIIEYTTMQYALQILSSLMIDAAAVHTMTLW
jgi:hypothetical protein